MPPADETSHEMTISVESLSPLSVCYALFEYLALCFSKAPVSEGPVSEGPASTSDSPATAALEAAIAILERATRAAEHGTSTAGGDAHPIVGVGSSAHESLLTDTIWIIFNLHRKLYSLPLPPLHFRAAITTALSRFPASTPVLQALIDRRSPLSAFETRRILADGRRRHSECAHLHLAAFAFELGARPPTPHGMLRTPMAHEAAARNLADRRRRARAILEEALQTDRCASSASLWRTYLALELREGRVESACRLQLRAIQRCPGVKSLWLDLLRPPLVWSAPLSQVEATLALLVEKEIRLRRELPGTGVE